MHALILIPFLELTFIIPQEDGSVSLCIRKFGLAGWRIDPIVMTDCRRIESGVVVPLMSIVGKISGGILLLRGQLVPFEIVRVAINIFVCCICQLPYDVDRLIREHMQISSWKIRTS